MKKSIKISLVLFILLSSIFMYPITGQYAENIVSAQDTEYVPKNIFSEEYPNNYEVLTNSAWINKAINEMNNIFSLNIGIEDLGFYSDESASFNVSNNTFRQISAGFHEDEGTDFRITVNLSDYNKNNIEEIYRIIPKLFGVKVDNSVFIQEYEEMIQYLDKKFEEYNKLFNKTDTGFHLRGYKNQLEKDYPGVFDLDLLKDDYLYEDDNFSIRAGVRGVENEQIIYPFFFFEKNVKNENSDNIDVNLLINEKSENIDKIQVNLSDRTHMEGIRNKDNDVSKELKEEFNADNYTPINYTELMRDRSGKPGYKDTFYAEVMQYEEGSGKAIALLKKSGDIDQLYYAVFETLPDSRLVENDTVDVYGTLDGLYSYETVRGGTNTVPRIVVDKVLVEGIDY